MSVVDGSGRSVGVRTVVSGSDPSITIQPFEAAQEALIVPLPPFVGLDDCLYGSNFAPFPFCRFCRSADNFFVLTNPFKLT